MDVKLKIFRVVRVSTHIYLTFFGIMYHIAQNYQNVQSLP